MIESVLFSAARIGTFRGPTGLTNASGFFFERGPRLFLVTSRHVLIDKASGHNPDRIEIELHVDTSNLTRTSGFSVPLYRDGVNLWRQASDIGGDIDVAAIELHRAALPRTSVIRAFTPAHLQMQEGAVVLGSPLIILGFPLGFHDTLHRLPVARHATLASPFGIRFQGQGYFLTDARTHRGTSGAPVLMRSTDRRDHAQLPWRLLGIHSSRIDMGDRDQDLDDPLALNCAWYADVLNTLTSD